MGLALSLCLIPLAACSGNADGPDPFGPGRDPSGTADGGGAAALSPDRLVLDGFEYERLA